MFSKKNVVLLLGLLLVFAQVMLTTVTASVAPVASFTHSPTSPLINQVVVFDASGSYDPDGSITSYTWNFGDGSPVSVLPNPVTYHTYTIRGNYNVSLKVTDNDGLTDTTNKTLTVREHPVAVFTYSPEQPLVDEAVTFNASLSTPNGGTIVSYRWDFGDGNITTVSSPVITHTYTAPRNYTVILTVTDSEALTDTDSKSIKIIKHPVAVFTYSPEQPLVDEAVTFNASLSTPDGGNIISYYWDFGDGSNGTDVIVTHAYTATGNYNATLNITDNEGLTDIAWELIEVREHPMAVFTYSPEQPLVDEAVTFNASLSTPNGGTIVSYRWDFGDGNITTVTNPVITHTYTAAGNFTVNLTITDSEDLTDTYSGDIRILIAPTANFAYSPTMPIINETVTFNATVSYDPDYYIVSYRWDFGDGNITTVTNPVITHAYATFGTYNVTLTVTDNDALTETLWKLITVYTSVPIHDVAIVSVVRSLAHACTGQTVNITVVAKNWGNSVETFNVTVYYGTTEIETKTIHYALPGNQTTLVFYWHTTSVPYGDYVISAYAHPVQGETHTGDNNYTDNSVRVTIPGDVDGNREVDTGDKIKLAVALWSEPGDPNYDPYADVNGDSSIDTGDKIVLGKHLWESWP